MQNYNTSKPLIIFTLLVITKYIIFLSLSLQMQEYLSSRISIQDLLLAGVFIFYIMFLHFGIEETCIAKTRMKTMKPKNVKLIVNALTVSKLTI